MLLKLKTVLTFVLLLSSLSSFACTCGDYISFCDRLSEPYNSSANALIFIGEATGNCVVYEEESGELCEVRIDEIINGSIKMLDENENYPVANTDTTIWIFSDYMCTTPPPSGKNVYAPYPYNGLYLLSICSENTLSLNTNSGNISGYIYDSDNSQSIPLDEFLEALPSCLPESDCGDFDAWVGIGETGVGVCGAFYSTVLLLKGYDFTVNDSFTIIDNISGDTTVTDYSSFVSQEIFIEDQYSFTVYLTNQPECSETIEGDCADCLSKFEFQDFSSEYYTGSSDASSYLDLEPNNLLIQNEFSIGYVYDPLNTGGTFSTTLDVLANDPCSPDCVLFVDGDATEVLGQTLHENDENNASLTINDDCTITYEADATGQPGQDFFIYGFLNWQGDTVYAVAEIDINVAVPGVPIDELTFEVSPEIICDKSAGTFSLLFHIDDFSDIVDNFQYRVCDGDWVDVEVSEAPFSFIEIPEVYSEGSEVCIEIRDTDNPDAIFSYLKVVNCFSGDPNQTTFEVYLETVCDRITKFTSVILVIVDPLATIADNFQYKVCEGDWIDIEDSNSNTLVFEVPESFPEGSPLCIYVRDKDDSETVFSYVLGSANCSTVAIELLSFDGINTVFGNQIDWSTATEKDNDYFIIEKSFDGNTFNSIARIQSNGDSNIQQDYQYVDTENTNQTSYYRLVTVDHFGKREIVSKVVRLQARQSIQDIILYPLPAKSFIYLNVANDLNEIAEVDIFDASGKLILQKTFDVQNGQNHLEIDVNDLSNGIYVLNYKTSNGAIVKRFVK